MEWPVKDYMYRDKFTQPCSIVAMRCILQGAWSNKR